MAFGVDSTILQQKDRFLSDVVACYTNVFWIRHGVFLNRQIVSEAEQFMLWWTILRESTFGSNKMAMPRGGMPAAWENLIEKLSQLKAPFVGSLDVLPPNGAHGVLLASMETLGISERPASIYL